LALLSSNYQNHLTQQLSNKLHRDVQVYMYHDTSSMALALKDTHKGAIISLGTAFGVAFND
jgi:hypothetical protein